jgi:hypothetical protein
VRDNFLLLDQPAEELARPIGGVRGKAPCFQIEALFCSIQHRLCRGNLIVGASRRRLDIHDHGILDIDEVVQPISELHALVGLGCPCRLGIRRRDHLGRLALITALSFALGSTTLIVILGIVFSRRFGFECRKILSHRTLPPLLLSPIEFTAWHYCDHDFMIRAKIADELDPWIAEAKSSLIATFATGITKDKAAVRASIIEPWSNGQTEGQITKLKLIKRQMYGRAKIDLLQARLVTAA